MRIFSPLVLFTILFSGVFTSVSFAEKTDCFVESGPTVCEMGKKVDWVKISANEEKLLNGSIISFLNKKKNLKLTEGLDERVKYISTHTKDQKQQYMFLSTSVTEAALIGQSNHNIRFDGKSKSKVILALIVFYDKDRKAIGHQEQQITVKKLEPKKNSQLKELKNNYNLMQNKAEKLVYINVKNIKEASYFSFHASLKTLSPKTVLKQSVSLKDSKIDQSLNPYHELPYLEREKGKGNKIFNMIVLYDKNLKPISYISGYVNKTDYVR